MPFYARKMAENPAKNSQHIFFIYQMRRKCANNCGQIMAGTSAAGKNQDTRRADHQDQEHQAKASGTPGANIGGNNWRLTGTGTKARHQAGNYWRGYWHIIAGIYANICGNNWQLIEKKTFLFYYMENIRRAKCGKMREFLRNNWQLSGRKREN